MFLIDSVAHGQKASELIVKFQYNIDLLNVVLKQFPDASVIKENFGKFGFISVLANEKFNHIDFENRYGDLWAYPFYKFNAEINGVNKEIAIHTNPKKIMLVRRKYSRNGSVISFPSTKKNAKKGKFDQNRLFKESKTSILKFIHNHKDYKINTDNADKDLVKILNLM